MDITVVVYVIALVTVEIYKFRLNISAVILASKIRNLLFKRCVNYADSRRIIDTVGKAFQRIYFAVVAGGTLNKVMVIAIKIVYNIILGEDYLFYTDFRAKNTLLTSR